QEVLLIESDIVVRGASQEENVFSQTRQTLQLFNVAFEQRLPSIFVPMWLTA
ncbi:hypothetical protein HZD82_27025, partial [Pantoea agglomerans]|nr:hypothetical protein [Pantoea agglomerans]